MVDGGSFVIHTAREMASHESDFTRNEPWTDGAFLRDSAFIDVITLSLIELVLVAAYTCG
jgi:hypothetical protein